MEHLLGTKKTLPFLFVSCELFFFTFRNFRNFQNNTTVFILRRYLEKIRSFGVYLFYLLSIMTDIHLMRI